MLVRWARSGSELGESGGDTTTIEVDNLSTGYSIAVSTSISMSYAAESSNTGSINIQSFDDPSFSSLHILDGSDVVIEELTGSFVSGSIYGGDKYNYYATRSIVAIGTTTPKPQVFTSATASVLRYDLYSGSAPFYVITSGSGPGPTPTGSASGAIVPLAGQLFPRGVYAYE